MLALWLYLNLPVTSYLHLQEKGIKERRKGERGGGEARGREGRRGGTVGCWPSRSNAFLSVERSGFRGKATKQPPPPHHHPTTQKEREPNTPFGSSTIKMPPCTQTSSRNSPSAQSMQLPPQRATYTHPHAPLGRATHWWIDWQEEKQEMTTFGVAVTQFELEDCPELHFAIDGSMHKSHKTNGSPARTWAAAGNAWVENHCCGQQASGSLSTYSLATTANPAEGNFYSARQWSVY